MVQIINFMHSKYCADCGNQCDHDWMYKVRGTKWDFICQQCVEDKPDIKIIYPPEY